MARLCAAEELCRPHLMLSYIRNADCVLRNKFAYTTDELLRADICRYLPSERMGTLHREHLAAPWAEAHGEILCAAVLHHIEECGQRLPQIADNRDIRTHIFVELCGIYIKVHDLRLRCECRCVPCYAVAEARAEREQEVALLNRHVRGIGTVHPSHARIALGSCRNAAKPHECRDRGYPRTREQLTHVLCRIREHDAPAHEKQGAMRGSKCLCSLPYSGHLVGDIPRIAV